MKRLSRLLTAFLLSQTCGSAQNIYTYAGNGIGGFSGDGGQATSAQILPFAIASDQSGNIYFTSGHRIRKVNSSGVITTIAGTGTAGFSGDGGPATLAQLNNPIAVTVDNAGNIYVSDVTNARIRKISASGTITTIAGIGSSGFSGDGGPATSAEIVSVFGMITDQAGNLYFGDTQNQRIRKISAAGTITTIAGTGVNGHSGDGGQALLANICNPEGITIDAAGNLYFTEYGPFYNSVRKISTSGIITTIAGKYVGGGYSGDGGPADSAKVLGPRGITIDNAGNIYFADENNYRVRKISTSGTITTIAGTGSANYSGDGGLATLCEFNPPVGVAIDASNNIYVTDVNNNRVRVICQIGCLVNLNENISAENSILLYPNPNSGSFKFQTSDNYDDGEIILLNALGQKVHVQKVIRGENTVTTAGLVSGLYFYILQDKGKFFSGKVTIE